MTPWEEKLVMSGLDGETNKCTSVTEAIKAAGWKETTCLNLPGIRFFIEEGQRRSMLPLELQKNVHFFKKGSGEEGREATAEINRQVKEYIAAGRPEPIKTGLRRIIMVNPSNSHDAMTPARLMTEQELRVWLATDPKFKTKTAAKYDSTKHVGVVLLCWNGEHVYSLIHRKHCCRVTEADLRAMLERWMEHYGFKPLPTGLQPLGVRLQDHQLLMPFGAGLGWGLGLGALEMHDLVHLTDPITNEGVLPFSAQELSNPWSVDGSEGPSLDTLRQDLPGLEEQLLTERTYESQRSANFETVAVGLWHLKRQGLLVLPRLPVRPKRRNPHVPPTPDSRAATGGGGGGTAGAKRFKTSPHTHSQQQQQQPFHTGGHDEAKASQSEEEEKEEGGGGEEEDDSRASESTLPPPSVPGPLAMQGLLSGITTLLGKLAQVLGQDVTTVSPPLQGALAFLTTLERNGLVASESDLQYGDTIVTQAIGGAVEQLLGQLRIAQDTKKARKEAMVTLLGQHKEARKQCFVGKPLTVGKLLAGLEALKQCLQDATAERDQAQRDMQAQAVAVSEAQALAINSASLQAEVRQVIAKLQSQYAVLTDKLRPHDSTVARLQAAHDALAPAIQQLRSAWDECAAVRAQVNAAALETLHTQLQQHWTNLRQALTT